MAPSSRLTVVPPAAPAQQGWVWNGTNWVWDPDCDCRPDPCPPAVPGWCPPPDFPTPCPPWFPPPPGQAPWYPGANGGVSFSASPPANPIRGHFWWDGVMLHLFDGVAWVDIGPSAAGSGGTGVSVGPSPPASPVNGQLWFNGSRLFIWNGSTWVVSGTISFVQATAPMSPLQGDLWWDGSKQWIWDGSVWQPTVGSDVDPGAPASIVPVNIPWSATIVPDLTKFLNSYTLITGNFILGMPVNSHLVLGQAGIMKLIQDTTGSRVMTVSSGWHFLGGTTPVLSTQPNAQDLLHYYVDETGDVLGELHTDFTPSVTPPASTTIGNMTGGGGVASAFDGNSNKLQAASASLSFTGAGPTTVSGYVGQSFSTAVKILSATYTPPTNGNGAWSSVGGGPGSQYQLTINLRGKTGSTPPANSADGTVLFTRQFPVTSPSIVTVTTPLAMVPSDQTTAFNFLWVEVINAYSGTASGTEGVYCAQLALDVH